MILNVLHQKPRPLSTGYFYGVSGHGCGHKIIALMALLNSNYELKENKQLDNYKNLRDFRYASYFLAAVGINYSRPKDNLHYP